MIKIGAIRELGQSRLMQRIPTWNRSVLLLLIAVAAYFQTWVDLWPYWENKNATYTHGTLIALIAIWFVWRARPALTAIPASADLRLLPVVLLLSALWMMAANANILIAHAMLWPVLAFAILWAGVGWPAASRLAFPLAFLYFAIPFWDYLKPPLQVISATMVSWLTQLMGIPVYMDGPHVFLPDTVIYIALDCSGAHFLCVALAVGVLAGIFRNDSGKIRLLIIAIAGLLSMVFNWIRILLIILAYLHPTLKHGMETIGHFTFGWWVFALDLIVFYLVLRLVPSSGSADAAAPSNPSRTAAPAVGGRAFALAVVASVLLPVSSLALRLNGDYAASTSSPTAMPAASRPIAPDSRWQPQFHGPVLEERFAYLTTDGRVIELYRNRYHRQFQGGELISNGNFLFDPAVFSSISKNVLQVQTSDMSSIEANHLELVDKSGRRWSSLFTYVIDDDPIASARKAQFLTALRTFYDHPSAGVVAVTTPCGTDCADVQMHLQQMLVRNLAWSNQ